MTTRDGQRGADDGGAGRRPVVLLALARAALFWERLWPRLWPAAGVAGAFAALALLDVLPRFPFWLHALVLAAFAATLAFAVVRAVRDFRAPGGAEARHRLESDSGLAHRPLAALDDHPALGAEDPMGRALWRAHRARAVGAVRRLRVRLPSPGVAAHDPFGLRAAVVLVLVIGIAAGGHEAFGRFARALAPAPDAAAGVVGVDVWVTPPTYTGVAPFHLAHPGPDAAPVPGDPEESGAGTGAAVEVRSVPVGSAVLARIAADEQPVLRLPGGDVTPDVLGEGAWRAETTIDAIPEGTGEDGRSRIAVLRGGEEIAGWPVRLLPDEPPSIEFTAAPASAPHGRLRVRYAAEDDFGVSGVTLVIRNPAVAEVAPGEAELRIDLPLVHPEALTLEATNERDLSAHEWAGLPVQVSLEAVDVLGQAGTSEAIETVLPERVFNHPVARALAEQRKRLAAPTPEVIASVVEALDGISSRPKHFFDDAVAFLAMRVARARLANIDGHAGTARDGGAPAAGDGTLAAVDSVRRLLWDTALRIEDGEYAIAERALRDAQERLMQALAGEQFDEQMDQLLDELRQALDRYLAALAERLQDSDMQDLSDLPGMEYMNETDLQQMIEDARELARTGAMDAARATLAELQEMLRSIQGAMQAGSSMQQFSEASKMMQNLRGVARDQQGLLDQTFQQMRRQQGLQPAPGTQQGGASRPPEGTPGQPQMGGVSGAQDPGEVARRLAETQEDLRRRLGELMLGMDELFGQIPDNMGQAERAMQGAGEALVGGDPGGAVPHQSDALDQLRQTAEALAREIARQMRGMPGMMPGSGETVPGSGSDPFGRMGGGAVGGDIDDGSVRVPTEMERRRAREIFDELRRRAADPERPRIERDYIRRLLRPF